MIHVDAEVRQLSTTGGCYVNVLRGLTQGGIGVWGNTYKRPTYLLLAGNNWCLLTFEDENWRQEHLPGLIESWKADKLLELPSCRDVLAEFSA